MRTPQAEPFEKIWKHPELGPRKPAKSPTFGSRCQKLIDFQDHVMRANKAQLLLYQPIFSY